MAEGGMRFTFPPYGKKIEAVSLQNSCIIKIPRCKVTAIYPPLKNPFKWVDMDILALSKTLATFKVLVPSVRFNLVSV